MTAPHFVVRLGVKAEFDALLRTHHYLQLKEQRSYRTGINVVLEYQGLVVGVAIFTNFPVPELVVGLYGLERTDQHGFYELSRFCILPEFQVAGQNNASWFLARAIKLLRQTTQVRALLSYADSKYHSGTLYQATNFKYYGLTALKKDWKPDNNKPLSRGAGQSTGGLAGCWVPRTRKHRYLTTYSKKLTPKWVEQPYPKAST